MATTKERLLDASEELFRRQGMTGTGVKQILALADAPLGSLYHHFPGGKDELAAETIKRAGAHYSALVAEKMLGEDDIVAGICAAFAGAGETLRTTGFADACPIETIALEVASTNEPLRLATGEVFDSWIDGLTALLVDAGVAEAEAPPLARTVIAALEGAFILDRTARTTDALDACGEAMARLVEAAIPKRRGRRRPR